MDHTISFNQLLLMAHCRQELLHESTISSLILSISYPIDLSRTSFWRIWTIVSTKSPFSTYLIHDYRYSRRATFNTPLMSTSYEAPTDIVPSSLSAAMSDLPSHESSTQHQLHPDLIGSGSLFPNDHDANQGSDDWTTTAAAVAAVQAAQDVSQSSEASTSQNMEPPSLSLDMSAMSNAIGSGSRPGSALGRALGSAPHSATGSAPGSEGNSPPLLQRRLSNLHDSTDGIALPPKKTRKRSSAGTKAQRALIIEEGMPAEYEDPKGDFRTGVIYVHASATAAQACMRCHAIKRKCDNERPRCTGCSRADEPCAYEMNPATSRYVIYPFQPLTIHTSSVTA